MTAADRKPFGERLRIYRTSAGLSVAELAKRAHTARQVIYEIENGTRNYTIDQFAKLLRACGVSLDEFLRGASPDPTGHFDLFQMLRTIISHGNDNLIDGARLTLQATSELAVRLAKTRASPLPETREGGGTASRRGQHESQSKKKKPA